MSSQSPRFLALLASFSAHPSPPLPTTVLNVPLLFYICYNGHLDLLQKLRALCYLDRDVGEGNEGGMKLPGATPLWAALSRGHLECAKVIVEDLGGVEGGRLEDGIMGKGRRKEGGGTEEGVPSPLIIASQDGHAATVAYMISLLPHLSPSFVDLTLPGGETALFKAAQNGRLDVCKLLIEGGAKVGVGAKSGLDEVAIAGSMGWGEVVMELLRVGGMGGGEGGGDNNAAFKVAVLYCLRGLSPSWFVAVVKHVGVDRIREALLEGGTEGLIYLISSKRLKEAEICKSIITYYNILIGRGIGEDEQGVDGQEVDASVAPTSVDPSTVASIRTLNVGGFWGSTSPLILAASSSLPLVVETLLPLTNSEDVNKLSPATGKNALHVALDSQLPLVAQALLTGPPGTVDVNLPTSQGVSPLHLCALWGSKDTCTLLLERGADVHRKAGVKVAGKVRQVTPRGVANALDNGCVGMLMEASKREVGMRRGVDKPEWAKKYEGDLPGPPEPPAMGSK